MCGVIVITSIVVAILVFAICLVCSVVFLQAIGWGLIAGIVAGLLWLVALIIWPSLMN